MGGTKTTARTASTIVKKVVNKKTTKKTNSKNAKRLSAPSTTKREEQPQTTSSSSSSGQEWWRTMTTLYVKRFADDDPTLTAGAQRNRKQHPHVAFAELDPSGRSKCKQCGELIQPKGQFRMGMMLECEKGYRFACTLHEACFWNHRESKNIRYEDIFIKPGVKSQDVNMIQAKFNARSQQV